MNLYAHLTSEMQKQTQPAARELAVTAHEIERLLDALPITVDACLRLAVQVEKAAILLNKVSIGIGNTAAFLGLREGEKRLDGKAGTIPTVGNPTNN